jgi:hypothetical protein
MLGLKRGGIVENQAAAQSNAGKVHSATPEQVVARMSVGEIQELLNDLGMQADAFNAQRLRTLVLELRNFEMAIAAVGGPASMGTLSKPIKPTPTRRVA